jgi:galactose mutarotase-like enzyme
MSEASAMAVQKENVLIRTGNCALTILPKLGCKISSIQAKGHEILQTPLAPYALRTQTMPFDAGDASGWEECFPSAAECVVETVTGRASIPDRGDLWRVAWTEIASSEHSITYRGECFSLPLVLDRSLTLSETAKGWLLKLEYTATNTGGIPAPWSWAAHPFFAAEAGDRIVLPGSIQSPLLEGSSGDRLGQSGDLVAWPEATLADGGQTDLSLVQPPDSGIDAKLLVGPLTPLESWCALDRPRAGLRIRVSFDPAATPYLGLWICHGGRPRRPGPKQACVALEPSTAPVDSLAKSGPWSRVLSPGESCSWPMVVEIDPN